MEQPTNLIKDPESVKPTTTEQEDITKEGQRRINLIWENTQSRIALSVVFVNLFLNSVLCLIVLIFNLDITANKLALLSLLVNPISLTMGIVIGFYFGRTNHTAIGGIGKKEGTR